MEEKREKIQALFRELRGVPGLDGAALLSRSGIPLLSDLVPAFEIGTFGAMCAAMLGAAETAMAELGGPVPERVVVEGRDRRLMAIGVDAELLLVIVARAGAQAVEALEHGAQAVQGIRRGKITG